MSELLKNNTTITELDFGGWVNSEILFLKVTSLATQSDNTIGDVGGIEISKALETNTTLLNLDLWCEGYG